MRQYSTKYIIYFIFINKEYVTHNHNIEINNEIVFSCSTSDRVISNKNVELIDVVGIDEEQHDVVLKWDGKEFNATVALN